MRHPALALSWQLWRPFRWVWAAVAAYVLVLAAVCHAVPAGELRGMIGSAGMMPLIYAAIFALGVLAFVTSGHDLRKPSGFPSWMFVLPLPTRALTGWVMLNGTAALVAAWLAIRYGIMRPCRLEAPASLTLLAPTILAWIQVFAWTPFAFPVLRVLLMIAVLTPLPLMSVVLELIYGLPVPAVVAFQSALIAGAYLCAWHGVSRARRGDVRLAHWPPQAVVRLVNRLPRRPAFASAAGAQLWYEWRRNGMVFPLMAGILLTLDGVLAVFGPSWFLDRADDRPAFELFILVQVIALPVGLGMLFGSGMSKGDVYSGGLRFPAFLAVRPLSTATLVAVKLRMLALSAAAASGLTFLAVAGWFLIPGNAPLVAGPWRGWLQHYPPEKAWTLAVLFPPALVLATWKNLAEGLWVGLTGRKWVGVALAAAWSALLLLGGAAGVGLYYYPQYRDLAVALVPWLVALSLLVKGAFAVWLGKVLLRRRLLTGPFLARCAALWCLAVACLFGAAWWLLPEGRVSPAWLAVGCVFAVPFSQIALAPLALEWNRHR